MQIELAPEVISQLGPIPITNTMVVSWITMIILILVSFIGTRKLILIPGGFQNFLELIVGGGYGMVEDLAQDKAKTFFPIVMTFFLFIITANWLGLLPGFSTIGLNKEGGFLPLLRSINSDLNTTLSLALISVVLTHAFSIKYLGILNYLKRWVSLNPIFLFVGLLEIVAEFTKLISLSFRLFGNIFAGELVLSTVASIFAFIAPLPFYLLEVIVGFVQAAVFMMLTLVFMVILSQKPDTEGH